jgi:hypothetical protein
MFCYGFAVTGQAFLLVVVAAGMFEFAGLWPVKHGENKS